MFAHSASKDHVHLGPACYTYTLKVRAIERWVEVEVEGVVGVVGGGEKGGEGKQSVPKQAKPSPFFPHLLGSYTLPRAVFSGGEGGARSQQAPAKRECERMPRC